ncbi:MAG: hypothetical protein KGH57_02945 [Candidatus Micrarchaeota archaeon]|nr:hypothetical protein [Candidatus Micrarchaeota archaeon]
MRVKNSGKKAQPALEYLMTYAWAIVIIAVVLVALIELGIFSGNTTSGRAQPGACQVFRPGGPLSTFNLQLTGLCNGEIPQYVPYFAGPGVDCSNIGAPYVQVNNFKMSSTSALTISFWAKSTNSLVNNGAVVVIHGGNHCSGGWGDVSLGYPSTYIYNPGTGTCWSPVLPMSTSSYGFFTLTLNGAAGTATVYSGTSVVGTSPWSGSWSPAGSALDIGVYSPTCSDNFQGYISNVQIYNASLAAPEVNALYLEGIGGAPLVLQNLVAWWPLNGNANDYSGDNQTGIAVNVVFSSQWTDGYSTP